MIVDVNTLFAMNKLLVDAGLSPEIAQSSLAKIVDLLEVACIERPGTEMSRSNLAIVQGMFEFRAPHARWSWVNSTKLFKLCGGETKLNMTHKAFGSALQLAGVRRKKSNGLVMLLVPPLMPTGTQPTGVPSALPVLHADEPVRAQADPGPAKMNPRAVAFGTAPKDDVLPQLVTAPDFIPMGDDDSVF